ncbi:hypothetical protein LTR27_011133 [Elasticomyces elasticus]|nr:hypothetical protein LTR27_011133 [Elasticomyces elasticus]
MKTGFTQPSNTAVITTPWTSMARTTPLSRVREGALEKKTNIAIFDWLQARWLMNARKALDERSPEILALRTTGDVVFKDPVDLDCSLGRPWCSLKCLFDQVTGGRPRLPLRRLAGVRERFKKRIDKSSSRQPSQTSTQPPPPRFLQLPPELRNAVYELVFDFQPSHVDLLEASPPSKAFLQACHQTYAEAKVFYNIQFRRYWSETDFAIHAHNHNWRDKKYEVDFTKQDLDHVRHLRCFITIETMLRKAPQFGTPHLRLQMQQMRSEDSIIQMVRVPTHNSWDVVRIIAGARLQIPMRWHHSFAMGYHHASVIVYGVSNRAGRRDHTEELQIVAGVVLVMQRHT